MPTSPGDRLRSSESLTATRRGEWHSPNRRPNVHRLKWANAIRPYESRARIMNTAVGSDVDHRFHVSLQDGDAAIGLNGTVGRQPRTR
jgi:hypothetical protein